MLILLFLLLILPMIGSVEAVRLIFGWDFNLLPLVLGPPVEWLIELILSIAGVQ
jgi:hypothetical protein